MHAPFTLAEEEESQETLCFSWFYNLLTSMTNHSWSPYGFDLCLNAPINWTMLGWFDSFLSISTSGRTSSIARSCKPITFTAAKCPDLTFFSLNTAPKLPSPTFSNSCQSTGALKCFNLPWWWSFLAAILSRLFYRLSHNSPHQKFRIYVFHEVIYDIAILMKLFPLILSHVSHFGLVFNATLFA